MSQHEIGAGDVKIHLEGHGAEVLRPTLDACVKLSSGPGGINKMFERVRNLEFSAILAVIEAGLGKTSKELPNLIYQTGLVNLHVPCSEFLAIISNGGRRFTEEDKEGEKDPLKQSSL